ncbi:MAG: adenine phosphoribosyltransferase, partial [Acidimicrobiaceae bacterium]
MRPSAEELKGRIRDIPDFPRPGVVFKDITPLLADARSFRASSVVLVEAHAAAGVDLVLGIVARGFVFAAPVAERLGAG